ncbi:DUF3320 domain-containing protein [Parafannyhessea umbonata]|uniref:DUF3320 domain-containing protein n=1 Tax=Parafannyhessea umbonata TaxID=604330 RepID=UPI0026EB762C|nr:DUF3320 domain-containing protein [Parafannyhessea umbonata]MDD7199450.1 DUF3320 domain-containing protein [Parafannyhessea umbonata]MDY4418696.1 DUF3320 domain-containing protein [Parafannyhessea umbonata]
MASNISVSADVLPIFNYSNIQALRRPMQSLSVTNDTDSELSNVLVRVDSATDLLTDRDFELPSVPPHTSVEVDCSSVTVDAKRLLQLTERMVDNVRIDVMVGGETLASTDCEILFFAFDQWLGTPETLAAFVTPNHPALAPVIVRASEILKEWTGSPSFDGYQTGDANRVRMQAAALFRSLQEQGIVYVGAPASFSAGQRVRMADAVLSQHMATCLDFSCLYASCLEAVDLRPFIVLIEGHAFAGVWLEESTFAEAVEEDATAVSKRFQKGVDQLTVVQATMIAEGSKATFEDAELSARSMVDPETFQCAVDVRRARYSQIIPLPVRVMGDDGWHVEAPKVDLGKAVAPDGRKTSTAVLDVAEDKHTRRQTWERNLLDLSMHNNLLNMRPGARVMPLLIPSVDELEDFLALDNDIVIAPKPNEFPNMDDVASSIIDLSESGKQLLRNEFREGRLRTAFTEAALQKNLTNLYRSSRSSMEETGSNTLFLSLGTLKWVDEKRGGKVRLAPIMLFPVDLVRKSAKAGYVMRLRDEDPQINISLLEMLRQDFGISINGLDPLPADDAGVDTRLVLNTVLSKVMEQKGWEVLENGMIGLFSFSQFVMWSDIRNREDDLRDNRIVNSMMEGHLTWTPEPIDPGEKVDPSTLLLPAEADSSQMLAIKKAVVDGQSFVLHGPPGTGKSQTISLLIANALARGKRVLFVAEKMAALEVVEHRLAVLGLEPFCLEVHSTKATKNHVFEQIKAAAELGQAERPAAYASKAAEVRTLRQRLDTYARGLEQVNGAGFTLREQICRYEELARRARPMRVSRELTESIGGQEDFAERINAAERLLAQGREFAPSSLNPLAPVRGTEYAQGMREELAPLLAAYTDALRLLDSEARQAAEVLGGPVPSKREDYEELASVLQSVARVDALPRAWVNAQSLQMLLQDLSILVRNHDRLEELHSRISLRRTDSFFSLDPAEIRASWVDANSKGMLRRGKAISSVLSELSLSSRETVGKDGVAEFLDELEGWGVASADLAKLLDRMRPYLADFTHADDSVDWEALDARLEEARDLLATDAVSQELISSLAGASDVGNLCAAYLRSLAVERDARARVEALLGPLAPVGEDRGWVASQIAACESVSGNLDGLRQWMGWNVARSRARSLGLAELVDYLDDHAVEDDTLDSFECGVFRTMTMASLDSLPGMNAFTGSRFSEVVRQYSRADSQLRDLARQEIYYEVASRTPDLSGADGASPQAVRLQRALRSRGRNVTVRSVFSECGDVVFSLCPCLLMSPLSVAQYLEPGSGQFDLVVFDEASQLQTCKAVGALSRAKEAVIVGDPKQMPPTSFFQGKAGEEDYEEVSDLESVLEDCLALNMPQTYLRWHYRSRHESLIAFSNKRFYENRMLTFPSADDRTSHVVFRKVEGTFERGGARVNRAEAEAVVAEIARRYKDPALSSQSVGVVTFNIPQQTLIEDLFQQACIADPSLDAWAHAGDEPVFIKNLENVQGDERDAILFSITYAPDANGRMSMNFGPINREGGWRRLNVAVTRARQGMVVFSSIEPTDIDLNRTSSAGPASLRAFLEYARRGSFGSVSVAEMQASETDDTIARELCERLAALGYRTKTNVGRSAYRVDVAVVDPANEGQYIAGILLDGRFYRMAGTTRDREIAQPELLEGLGWKVTRVWAIDWWEDPDAVVDEVRRFLEEALGEKGEPIPAPGTVSVAREAGPAPVRTPATVCAEEPVATESEPEPKPEPEAEPKPEPEAEPKLELELEPEPELESISESVPKGLQPATEPEDEGPAKVAAAGDADSGFVVLAPAESEADGDVPVVASQDAGRAEAVGRRRPYRLARLEPAALDADFLALDKSEVASVVEAILDVEAPIEEGLLYRRITRHFGVRMGSKIRAKCEEGVKAAHGRRVTQAGRTIVWLRGQDPKSYVVYRVPQGEDDRRSFDELPLEEIAAAALEFIENNGPSEQEDLVRGVLHELEFSRLTAAAREYLQKGLTFGIRRGLYKRNKSTYLLPDEAE